MTELRDHASQCAGKEPYATSGLAHRVAKRRNDHGKLVKVYHCPHCGAWHMGTLPRLAKQHVRAS